MELQGSCHCGKVSFSVTSHTPAPFMRCYCSICRKCQGGGGYAINIMGQHKTLKVNGREHVRYYRALRDKETNELCGNIRYFCSECGSHLYAYNESYSDFVYPMACAIDTPLPELSHEDVYCIMLNDKSKANWAIVPPSKHTFQEYPDVSLEEWHKKHNQYIN
ncbi:Mss4-like protein [Radiomyces spectabilis]|uniref:Mss4-like protein n=1 Tax=Radiomyces spectabilis TaxID=64574 RepID=UPI00221F25A0|nr:Mss4-like protein [Radiomyces spectabilis]KAI8391230.1 Mss4-like protein [Radiomyces spectabilis]